MCKTIDGIGKRKVYRTALALTKSDSLATEFTEDVAMQPDEIEMIASLSETVATQYALMGQHSPAILLGVAIVGVGARYGFVLNKLNDIQRVNAAAAAKAATAKEKPADAPKPSAQ